MSYNSIFSLLYPKLQLTNQKQCLLFHYPAVPNHWPDINRLMAEFRYGKYLILLIRYTSTAYLACLVSPWVFWLVCILPKYMYHGSTKLTQYAAEAHQKGLIKYKISQIPCKKKTVSSERQYGIFWVRSQMAKVSLENNHHQKACDHTVLYYN